MLNDIFLILIGLVALFMGGNWLVRGASRLATSFGVSSLIIGLTVVAVGTSMPELLVSVTAGLRGESEIALGNVVGSNIANIGLILGIAGLITPVAVHASLVRREIPIMIFVSIFAYLIVLDAEISRLDGVLLLFGFVAVTALFYFLATRERDNNHTNTSDASEIQINRFLELGFIAIGVVVLALGADWLVRGAVSIATALGVSELIIGISIVAVGTSLPEMATSIIAAIKKESDIAVGNVVGSNIANLLLILGATAAINPIPVDAGLTQFEFIVMIAFAMLMYPFGFNQTLTRRESAIFLGAYAAFIIFAFVR